MPPKKKEVVETKIKLGRPGNTLKMGIVGLPNVGKSSTFNVLTKLNVPAENYPFCTIEPNLAQVAVPDERFRKLQQIWKPKSNIQAVLRIQDIAGLVPGAHKGEGLGNQFLSHIRESDAIYHVVRAFDDPEVVHTELDVDPVRDLQIIFDELLFKDKDTVEKKKEEIVNNMKRQGTDQKPELQLLTRIQELMDSGKWVIQGDWVTNQDIEFINKMYLLTAKPVVYLVNLCEEDYLKKKNKWLQKIKIWIDANMPGTIIPYSAEHERKLLQQQQEKQEESKEDIQMGETSCLPKIIKTGYKTLDLITFFTCGVDEVRCWTCASGTKAPQAGGVIHGDFEKGFICADIMKYDDFIQYGSEAECKANGKYHQKGKESEVFDGDIIFFKFNTPQKKK